jgi:hypothetical protein
MSERSQFTNESPVRREDECVDAGETITNGTELQIGMKKMRDLLLGVMALQGVGQNIMGTAKGNAVLAEVVEIGDDFPNDDLVDLNDAFDELLEYDKKQEPEIERFSPETDDVEYLAFLAEITKCESGQEMYQKIMERKRLEGRPDLAYI